MVTCVSLPTDKLLEIQQLTLSLLQMQPVTVCLVMSFSGKANFYASRHAQLWQLSCEIESDMSTVYYSPTHLFLLFTFLFKLYLNFRDCLSCSNIWFQCRFLCLMWLWLWMLCLVGGPVIFRVLDNLIHSEERC